MVLINPPPPSSPRGRRSLWHACTWSLQRRLELRRRRQEDPPAVRVELRHQQGLVSRPAGPARQTAIGPVEHFVQERGMCHHIIIIIIVVVVIVVVAITIGSGQHQAAAARFSSLSLSPLDTNKASLVRGTGKQREGKKKDVLHGLLRKRELDRLVLSCFFALPCLAPVLSCLVLSCLV